MLANLPLLNSDAGLLAWRVLKPGPAKSATYRLAPVRRANLSIEAAMRRRYREAFSVAGCRLWVRRAGAGAAFAITFDSPATVFECDDLTAVRAVVSRLRSEFDDLPTGCAAFLRKCRRVG